MLVAVVKSVFLPRTLRDLQDLTLVSPYNCTNKNDPLTITIIIHSVSMEDVAETTGATPASDEHVDLLTTKWWTVDQFRRNGEWATVTLRAMSCGPLKTRTRCALSRRTIHAGRNRTRQ
jgi:hypothetical protein